MSSETVKEGDRCPKCRADSLTATEAEGGMCYDCQRNMREQKKVVDPLVQALLAMTRMRDAAIADCRVLAAECKAHRGSSGIEVYRAKQATDAAGLLEKYK